MMKRMKILLGVLSVMISVISCHTEMKLTLVPDLDEVNVEPFTSPKNETFLVNNPNKKLDLSKELRKYSTIRFKNFSHDSVVYSVLFIKETKFVNLSNIQRIGSFNDIAVLDSLESSKLYKYYYKKDSVIISTFKNGKIVKIEKIKLKDSQ